MREEVTIDFKNYDAYEWYVNSIVEVFNDYDFPCYTIDSGNLRFSFTDIKPTISIQGTHLYIDIKISKKDTISIPIKLDTIKAFYFDRVEGKRKYKVEEHGNGKTNKCE